MGFPHNQQFHLPKTATDKGKSAISKVESEAPKSLGWWNLLGSIHPKIRAVHGKKNSSKGLKIYCLKKTIKRSHVFNKHIHLQNCIYFMMNFPVSILVGRSVYNSLVFSMYSPSIDAWLTYATCLWHQGVCFACLPSGRVYMTMEHPSCSRGETTNILMIPGQNVCFTSTILPISGILTELFNNLGLVSH